MLELLEEDLRGPSHDGPFGSPLAPDSRTQILDAAEYVLIHYGLHDFQVKRVEDCSGHARSKIHRDVGGKDALIQAVLDRWSERALELVRLHLSGEGPLEDRLALALTALTMRWRSWIRDEPVHDSLRSKLFTSAENVIAPYFLELSRIVADAFRDSFDARGRPLDSEQLMLRVRALFLATQPFIHPALITSESVHGGQIELVVRAVVRGLLDTGDPPRP